LCIEHHATGLKKTYEKIGGASIKHELNTVNHRIEKFKNNRYLGCAVSGPFMQWVNTDLQKMISKKTIRQTRKIINNVVLATAVNCRFKLFNETHKPCYANVDIGQMFGVSSTTYSTTYKTYSEWVESQLMELDVQAVSVVQEGMKRMTKES